MKNRNNISNFCIGVLAYLIFILLAYLNFKLFSFVPVLLIIGILGNYFILGAILNEKGIWGGRIAIISTYAVGGIIYTVGRLLINTELIATFRRLIPQVYHSVGILEQWTYGKITRDTLIAVFMVVFLILSLLVLEFGKRVKISTKERSGFTYNVVLVWMVHFYLFMPIHIIVSKFTSLMNDTKQSLIFGAIMTIILFVTYFFLGKESRTLKSKVLQCLSSSTITLTAIILYVLGLLFIVDIGVYERYMLPVVTSYIGTLCRSLGIMTGANVKVVSQYGFLATSIMIIVPTLMITVGKFTSLSSSEKEVEGTILSAVEE